LTAITLLPDGLEIRFRLTPKCSADRVEYPATDSDGRAHIKARVRAIPENGAANKALIALIAKTLRVPKSSITLVRGATARIKVLRVLGNFDLRQVQTLFGETVT